MLRFFFFFFFFLIGKEKKASPAKSHNEALNTDVKSKSSSSNRIRIVEPDNVALVSAGNCENDLLVVFKCGGNRQCCGISICSSAREASSSAVGSSRHRLFVILVVFSVLGCC
jgi:hypothetical protein